MVTPETDARRRTEVASLAQLREHIDDKLERLCRDFGADVATFHLWSKEEERLVFPAGVGLQHRMHFETWVPSDRGPAARILHDGKAVFAQDAENHPEFRGPFTFEEEIKSGAAFPLRTVAGNKFGIIFLNYRLEHRFNAEEEARLGDAVQIVGGEIEALLTPRVEEELRQQAPLRREEDALGTILRELCELLPDTEAIVWLSERQKGLALRAHSGCRGFSALPGATEEDSDSNFIGRAYRTGELQTATVKRASWPQDPFHDEGAAQRGWLSSWAFPLGRYGVLTIYKVKRSNLTSSEQRLAQIFADQIKATIADHTSIRTLQMLGDVGNRLNAMVTTQNPRRLLDAIVKAACEVMRADFVALLPYDPMKMAFLPVQEYGVMYPPGARLEQPRANGLSWKVLQEGRSVIEDTLDRSRVSSRLVDTGSFAELGLRAAYGVALKADDQSWGVLHVNYLAPHLFDRDETTLISLFANYAASALRNWRLQEDLQRSRLEAVRRAEELDTVLALIQGLNSESRLEDLLARVASEARSQVKADSATVYQYDREYGEFFAPVTLDPADHLLPRSDGSAQAIIEQGHIIFADDAAAHPVIGQGSFIREKGVKSCMAAPLQVGDDPVGILYVDFWSAPHRFTDDEKRVLIIIANQAAVEIQSVGRLHEANEQLETVLHSIEVAKECDTLAELLKAYLEFALMQIGAECGTLQLLDPAAPPRLITHASMGDVARPDYLNISIEQGITGRAMRQKSLVYVPDAFKDPDHLRLFDGVRSELAVPLLFGDISLGVLNAESSRPDAFDIYGRRLFARFAAAAAVIIRERVQLESAQKKQAEAEQEALVVNMTRAMAHNIKNSLGAARFQLDWVMRETDLSPEQREELGRVDANVKMSVGIVENIFKPYRPEPQAEVNVGQLVEEALRSFGPRPDIVINVNIPQTLPLLRIQPTSAVSWIQELLTNAATAIEKGQAAGSLQRGEIVITARLDEAGDIEILFTNTGPAIPKERWESIFDQFAGWSREAADSGHLGLGLWGARTFFRRQGGNLSLHESDGRYTTFVVTLPAAEEQHA